MNSHLKPLIAASQIDEQLTSVAAQITQDYAAGDLVVIAVMKGALCVTADLIRKLDLPVELQYVQCASYGARGTTRGELQIIGLDRLNIQNRDVLIVDDIFDSGATLSVLINAIQNQQPRSVKSLVLLSKNVPHATTYRPDYVLFPIEDLFVVGYGLDFKEKYRGLDGVYVYE